MTTEECDVFKTAISAGCCKRCALRFIAEKERSSFQGSIYCDPDGTIENCGYVTILDKDEYEPSFKKLKVNSCVVCLGSLQDEILDEMIAHRALKELEQYDNDKCVMYIALPTCISIRERSMEIYLKEKFPDFYNDHQIVPINKVWRWTIEPRFAQVTKKTYNRHSKVNITFSTSYNLDVEETNVMHRIRDKIPNMYGKKWKNLSKHVVKIILDNADDKLCKQYIMVPPRIPIESVKLKDVTYSSISIFAAGTYCKFSRLLFQYPGKFDNTTASNEYSIQKIIVKAMQDILNHKNAIEFKVGGTEDYNVRVLGNGRPFYVQISNPKFATITYQQFRNIEQEIKKSNAVEVKNFQLITKYDVQGLVNGELNPKTYNALCKINELLNLQYYINLINNIKEVKIFQRTPTKKTFSNRDDNKEKVIYSMKATPVEDKPGLVMIKIHADSGLYISEFISGDEGRTSPSLINLIDQQIDLLELDIIDIFSDLPEVTEQVSE